MARLCGRPPPQCNAAAALIRARLRPDRAKSAGLSRNKPLDNQRGSLLNKHRGAAPKVKKGGRGKA
jgi:hypothetical protein